MLRIENLNFFFGEREILRDISGEYAPGKIHGIIGPNGSGKSTLLKNICRVWEPGAGTVFIDGRDYRAIPRKHLSTIITLVPQNSSISFPISVYEIVAMGRHPHLGRFQGITKKDKEIIEKTLVITGIYDLKEHNINELSGGEGQLAIIARALATEAPVMLLDEPTADLDVKHALAIMALLCEMKEHGKTILVSIHDLNLARRYCDTISILNRGEMFFTGSPEAAFSPENVRRVFNVNMIEIRNDSQIFLHFYS